MTEDPARIGRYVVEAALGRGAMGVVYRAHDPAIDRIVAIKLIRADLLHGDEQQDFIARFRQEARAAGRCTHPNIVAIYDFALHEGNPFLAMELVDGTDLRRARSAGDRPAIPEVIAIAVQVLAALGAAHESGIVHRDIKPANIMLTKAGQVKVTDFGISQIQSAGFTQSGMILGTPSYMSPEQWRGAAIDGRSDLFSLGIVLYELLTGQRPFAGEAQTEIMYRLLNDAPEDPVRLRPDTPPALSRVILKALAKSPEARFARAADMAAALAAAVQHGAASDDATIVAPLRPASIIPAFDPEILQSLERRLAQFVGPIAGRMVQSAVQTSGDIASLCATLASKIDNPADRSLFQSAVDRQLASGATQTAVMVAAAIPPAELERIRRELAVFVGPLARILVKNAVPLADSQAALWHDLAIHIPNQSDRAAFLAKAPRAS